MLELEAARTICDKEAPEKGGLDGIDGVEGKRGAVFFCTASCKGVR